MWRRLILFLLTVEVDLCLTLSCRTIKEVQCRWNSTCQYDLEDCTEISSHRLGGVYCTTLMNSMEDLLIEQMGCMYDQETTKKCQNQSQCLMKFINAEKKFLHCCCDKDSCNIDLNLSDPILRLDSSSSISKEFDESSLKKYIYEHISIPLLIILLFILILSLILFPIVVYRRKSIKEYYSRLLKKRSNQSTIKVDENTEDHQITSPLLSSNNKIIDLDQIEISRNILKNGRSSQVRKGFYRNQSVALKYYQTDLNQSNHLSIQSIFEHERDIYLLPKMDHPNILKFYGYSMNEANCCCCLIFDYVDQGSLRDYLRLNQIPSEEDLINMIKQISDGVEYIHRDFRCQRSSNEETTRSSIAHRDLKTDNILRYSNGHLVICDFAMSIQLDENHLSTFDHQQIGTARYMAPEILAGTISNDFHALLRCDVYSLGLIFWEILSRYSQLEGTNQYEMPFEAQLIEKNFNRNPSIDEMLQIVHLDPPLNRPLIRNSWRKSSKINEILLTIEQCWHSLPESRINSSLISHRIRQISSI